MGGFVAAGAGGSVGLGAGGGLVTGAVLGPELDVSSAVVVVVVVVVSGCLLVSTLGNTDGLNINSTAMTITNAPSASTPRRDRVAAKRDVAAEPRALAGLPDSPGTDMGRSGSHISVGGGPGSAATAGFFGAMAAVPVAPAAPRFVGPIAASRLPKKASTL